MSTLPNKPVVDPLDNVVNWSTGKRGINPNRPKLPTTRPQDMWTLFATAASLPRPQAIEYLLKNRHSSVQHILRTMIDPSVKWLIKADDVTYTPSTLEESRGHLYNQARTLYLYC